VGQNGVPQQYVVNCKKLVFSTTKTTLTVYARHQILITELEIWAVGTDLFEADVVVGTRSPGKDQNIKINAT
jgi:hypothetical protein